MLLFHGGCLDCLTSRSARRFSRLYVLDEKFRCSIFAIRWNASAQCTCLFIYYTVHPLLTYSYSLYQALWSTKAAASGSTLPKPLSIGQTSTTMPPTHIAAAYSSAPSGPESCRVMMYLIHQSIIYCANLPMLAPSMTLPTTPEAPFEVPVVLLALPNLDSFPARLRSQIRYVIQYFTFRMASDLDFDALSGPRCSRPRPQHLHHSHDARARLEHPCP